MATATTADIGNPEVLREMLHASFRPGRGSLSDLVDAWWTNDAVFKTPMATLKGKANLYHFFHFWQNAFDDRLDILDVAAQGDKIMVRVRHNLMLRPFNVVRHLMPAIVQQLVNFPLIITATLDTVQTARGRKISGWYEDVSVYTLILNTLIYNKVVNLHDTVELVLGQGIVFADQAGRAAYHLTAPHVLPLVDRALGAADALGKEYLGRDLHLLHSARSIWS